MKHLLVNLILSVFICSVSAQNKTAIIQKSPNAVITGTKAPKSQGNTSQIRPTQKTIGKKASTEFQTNDNSFFVSLDNVSVAKALERVRSNFKLSDNHTYQLSRENTDDIGMSHYSYAQYYKGVRCNEGMIL